jgi:hypothetical protein
MAKKFEVSFNSPQCGWMSIGFKNNENEFSSTTAHAPHKGALSEILNSLSSMLEASGENAEFKINWSRNPEVYNLFISYYEQTVFFQVVEYPTFDHLITEGEIVFSHNGNVKDFCQAFYETFAQLYEARETDEFEANWHQPFPFDEFENFESVLQSART